ncbi:hypothetical protein [Sporichthya polymorpha]|uniref:hypothetical protein n=1 Tax=Sporichthya polymorpha TaxID=35751 RepID=UPI00035E420B|nr:hypothetical protein [Sporichthya polymorpha]
MHVDAFPAASTSTTTQWDCALIVAWQHPETRSISPVGLLERRGDDYRFRYLRVAEDVAGFRPFLNFPELRANYVAKTLFPLFGERVMSPRRPDFGRYLATLHLDADSTPMEILARSEGRREADNVQLLPIPDVDADGRTTCRFLVHGVRHAIRQDPRAEARISSLQAGNRLVLVPEPTNPKNPHALLTCTSDDAQHSIGWAPDLLVPYLHAVRSVAEPEITVEHVNGPEVPAHLRVLARLSGRMPVGFRPFSGPEWSTFSD